MVGLEKPTSSKNEYEKLWIKIQCKTMQTHNGGWIVVVLYL